MCLVSKNKLEHEDECLPKKYSTKFLGAVAVSQSPRAIMKEVISPVLLNWILVDMCLIFEGSENT